VAANGSPASVAYFSMEIALRPDLPTYSGGLGILAGDYLRAAADKGLAMVGVTLVYRQGYFTQKLDNEGNQSEQEGAWQPESVAEPLPIRVSVRLEGREVWLRAWRFMIRGIFGHAVPVFLLDASLPENTQADKELTDHLYGGDERYRLCQEAILGLGGVAILKALGYTDLDVYHMNEGHSSLLGVALLNQAKANRTAEAADSKPPLFRPRCVFTTHTPVPAGHDQFPVELARQVLGNEIVASLQELGCLLDGSLNMTYLGLVFSSYINGVSMRHEELTAAMFPNYPIHAITNGIHSATWASESFKELYDRHLPEWTSDALYLRYAIGIPLDEFRHAHSRSKEALLKEVTRRTGKTLSQTTMTLGFARRAAAYKRADLLFYDLERLRSIVDSSGPIQLIFAGKAHPKDLGGRDQIRRVFDAARGLKGQVEVVYLEDYNFELAKLLCAGVDLWLNTPQRPLEASGTSGMKAALNGVPSLSVLDGWWIEGCFEGVTGWAIGDALQVQTDPSLEARSMYQKLESSILPIFYEKPEAYAAIRRNAVAINASFFNAERMVLQYMENAYS